RRHGSDLQHPTQAGPGAIAHDTRKSVDHRQVGLSWRQRLDASDTLSARGYFGDRRVRQFLAFSGAAPTSSGGVVDLDRGFGGANLQWSRSTRAAGGRLELAAGVDY